MMSRVEAYTSVRAGVLSLLPELFRLLSRPGLGVRCQVTCAAKVCHCLGGQFVAIVRIPWPDLGHSSISVSCR